MDRSTLYRLINAAREGAADDELDAMIADAREDEIESECESAEAARFEDAAHGYDLDDDHRVDPYTRTSVYDLDPGVRSRTNDAGEIRGWM